MAKKNIYYIDTDEIPGFFLLLKIISLSRAVKIPFLSFTREDIGVAMVTNIRFCCCRIFLFFIRILTFWNRKYKYYCLYFSFITLYPSFITFCDRHFAIGDHFNCTILLFRKWIKHKVVFYEINRTLRGRLGIRILSSRAESISHSFVSLTRERYFPHSKIKFVSPPGHVISSIYNSGDLRKCQSSL